MGYSEAIEKAGAKVIAYQEFGSYQGTWLAFVEYKGVKGIVEGAYGSCSGCDHYQATFDYNQGEPVVDNDGLYHKDSSSWDPESICTKEEYHVAMADYNKRFEDFGNEYLNAGLNTKQYYQDQLDKINSVTEFDYFSSESKEYCEWAIKQDW